MGIVPRTQDVQVLEPPSQAPQHFQSFSFLLLSHRGELHDSLHSEEIIKDRENHYWASFFYMFV